MKIAAQASASRGLGLWFEGDVVAEAFEATFEVGDGLGLADLVEIGFAEIAIGQVLGEHVIGRDEDLVGDGEGCAQAAAAGLEAVELVLEVAALGSRGGDRGADQDGAQMDVALPRPAARLPCQWRRDIPQKWRRKIPQSGGSGRSAVAVIGSSVFWQPAAAFQGRRNGIGGAVRLEADRLGQEVGVFAQAIA